MEKQLIEEQKKICRQYNIEYKPVDINSYLGISDNTNGVLMPINGLRHPIKGDTSGWYIWSGEIFLQDADFFKPIHIKHVFSRCPQVLKYLALTPGYRFLITNEYVDVWFDESLLDI